MLKRFHTVSQFTRLSLTAAIILATGVFVPSVAFAAPVELTLSFTGLEDLGPNWAYEGWLIVEGAPVSTGIFAVDGSGTPSATRFSVDVSDVSKVSAFVLTIEPAPDSDPKPSAVHVLAGDFTNNAARLSAGHAAALGDSFSSAAGKYILAAPSAGAGGSYQTGIWWLDPAAGPGPALSLPALPDGWVYEGWVVGPDGPISTGRFTSANGADSDGAGLTGGPNAAPPFPGQDFANPPLDLTSGHAAVISIEPEPDNSTAPFAFKPLVDQSIADVGEGVLQSMSNNASAFPTGTATLGGGQAPAVLPVAGGDNRVPVLSLLALAAGLLALGAAFRPRMRPR